MAERPTGKSDQRNRLARIFLGDGKERQSLFDQLTLLDILLGLAVALLITTLLVGFEFQEIPAYGIGDIADRTITAQEDFTVEDREATLQKKEEMRRNVPVVFDLNLGINSRVENELRSAFVAGRRLLAEEKDKLGIPGSEPLPPREQRDLAVRLRQMLPRFDQGRVLAIFLGHGFSQNLENQIVLLMREAMRLPGVVLNRDALLRYEQRGLILRNSITQQDESLNDWTAVRDLGQAREVLRQNEYQLTAVGAEEKKEMISFLDTWIVPNVHFNESETRALEQLVMQDVDPVLMQIKKGRILVRAGDEIKAREKMLLDRLHSLKQPQRVVGKYIGIWALVSFFLFALWHYFVTDRKRYKSFRKRVVLLLLVLTASLAITKIIISLGDGIAERVTIEGLQDPLNYYFLAPLALGAILVILLVGVPVAILYSMSFAVVVALMTAQVEMFIYSLTGSLAAIYLVHQYRARADIIKGGLIIGVVNALTVLSLQLYTSESGFHWGAFLVAASSGLLSGLLAAMLASLFLPILESLFQITTDIKLLELSNLNTPILRRLAVEAPGTYHHSIIVGTLAEAGAEAIGANALLVRVGAYYHDIGKLKTPEYYIENQIFTSNKHEQLSPTMSCLILSSHVKDGLAMAGEINLVPEVRDLIPQHHGTKLMTYFYQKARSAADGKERVVNEDDFRYPGPRPQTKEAAILMLADQVEAAARTLQEPGPTQIRGLIRRLIESNIQDSQFDECDITMRDLDKITQAFERVISGIHHRRIEYPGFEFNTQVDKQDRTQNQRIQ